MYLRTTRRTNRDGTEVTYLQLAESVWNAEKGQAEAKIVYSFGRADEVDLVNLRRLAESINRVCGREEGRGASAPSGQASVGGAPEDLELLPAKPYGGFYVVESLWKRLELDKILASFLPARRGRAPHVEALLAMVANRLLAPSSKLACYETWLRTGVFYPAGEALKLSQLYEALDFLYAHSTEVEEAIYFRICDLFTLDVDLIFFDTTSVYFEIEAEEREDEPEGSELDEDASAEGESDEDELVEDASRRLGHNKEGRDGNPQVVVALAVTRDGLPVRSWVFPGNTADVTTVAKVREDLKGWRLSRVLFVGDSGFYSAENLKTLSSSGGRYLLATPLRKVKELHEEVLSRAGRYKELNDKLGVKEVLVGEGEARRRYFVCRNQREAERAQRHRRSLLRRLRAELDALGRRRDKKDHPKRACELLSSTRFARFLSEDEKGRPFLDNKKVKADERFDGKWVVTTNDDTLSAEDGALGYKAALIIEACFRRMKTTGLKVRPVYHWRSRRIVAHVKVCVMALLLQRVAEIDAADTWRNLRSSVSSIQVVPCETPSGSFFKTTRPEPEALAVLQRLKIKPPPRLLAVTPRDARASTPPGTA